MMRQSLHQYGGLCMQMMTKMAPQFKVFWTAVLLLLLFVSRYVVIASLIGIGVAVLLSPILDRLKKSFKLKRGYGALVVLGVLFLILAALGFLFGWVLTEQVNALVAGFPELSARVQVFIENLFDRWPWLHAQIQKTDLALWSRSFAQVLANGAQLGMTALGGVAIALVLGLYLAIEGDSYVEGAIKALPLGHHEKAVSILCKCAQVIRLWFVGQLIDMAIIGSLTTVGLWLIGVHYWAFFGLLTGLFGVFPYVGTLIVVVLVSLVTIATNVDLLLWVWLVFFITQQVEGNLLLPMVMRGQAKIPEALLIITMLFFGFWFGLVGIFIAPPLTAVLLCLYRELYLV